MECASRIETHCRTKPKMETNWLGLSSETPSYLDHLHAIYNLHWRGFNLNSGWTEGQFWIFMFWLALICWIMDLIGIPLAWIQQDDDNEEWLTLFNWARKNNALNINNGKWTKLRFGKGWTNKPWSKKIILKIHLRGLTISRKL